MEEVFSISSLSSNEFLDPILDKEDLIKGFKVMIYYKQLFCEF